MTYPSADAVRDIATDRQLRIVLLPLTTQLVELIAPEYV